MRLIGSLTTIPSRISKIRRTIHSLLNQSHSLDKIYINIPYISLKGTAYKIPYFLKTLESESKIVINRCKDYGPSTKLIPTLEKEKNNSTYIIVFDDDRIMHRDVVKILAQKIIEYPEAALSFSGWCIGSFPFYFQRILDNTIDVEVDWVEGTNSICYPSFLLDSTEIITIIESNDSLFRHDDHIMAYYMYSKKIPCISICYNASEYFEDSYKTDEAISGHNILQKMSFIQEVANIGFFFKEHGIYYHNYNIYDSIIFLIMLIILIILIIFVLF